MGGWLYAFEIPDPPSVPTVTSLSSPRHTHTTVTGNHIHSMEEDERHTSSGADKLDGVSEDVEGSEERQGVEGGESGSKVGEDVERESGEKGGEGEGEREEERGEVEGGRGGEERREAELERGERTDESRTSSTDDITLDTGIGNLRHPADRPLGSRDPTPPILLAPEDDDRLTGDVTTGFRAVGGCVEEGHESHDLGTGSHDSKMNKTELESPTASPLHSSNIHDGFVFAIHRKTVSVSEISSSSPLQHLTKPDYSLLQAYCTCHYSLHHSSW